MREREKIKSKALKLKNMQILNSIFIPFEKKNNKKKKCLTFYLYYLLD